MKTADQVYRLRIFLFSFARLSKCRLSLEALVEILADRDSDLSDLDEERLNDFYEPSDPEESSKEEMSDENVEDLPDECKPEETKMAASWWVYKAPVGKGLKVSVIYISRKDFNLALKSLKVPISTTCCGRLNIPFLNNTYKK